MYTSRAYLFESVHLMERNKTTPIRTMSIHIPSKAPSTPTATMSPVVSSLADPAVTTITEGSLIGVVAVTRSNIS